MATLNVAVMDILSDAEQEAARRKNGPADLINIALEQQAGHGDARVVEGDVGGGPAQGADVTRRRSGRLVR